MHSLAPPSYYIAETVMNWSCSFHAAEDSRDWELAWEGDSAVVEAGSQSLQIA